MANTTAAARAWPPKERMVSEEESAGEPCSVMHESQLVLTFAAFRDRCSPTAACCCCCTIADLPERDSNEEAWIEKRKGRDKFETLSTHLICPVATEDRVVDFLFLNM
uniref:Uncharacterized protein n=1 Tax=Oryza punctata TaxID=4537 RepID=A0A0E0M980_ORYPU